MADNSRKYNLDVSSLISYGIGATGDTYQCSVLQAFSVNIDGSTCNYPAINTEQLGLLSVPAYEERVSDYLDYINIESDITKQRLIEEAQANEPFCDNPCGLNSNFLVYRFLEGVRVVDIGTVRGVAQYRAYEVGADPSGATWQNTGTFLNLDITKTYIFEVRDYFEYAEYCLVSRAISLPALVPSTTYTPPQVTVFLTGVASGNYGNLTYETGVVCSQIVSSGLPLSGVQRVQVNYKIAAEASGDATSCTELFCKTPSTSWTKFRELKNTSLSPVSDSFIMNAGDCVCYLMNALVPTCGSCACTCMDLTSVNGLSVTIPTINIGACCADITCSKFPLTVAVSTAQTTDSVTTTTCTQNGEFLFNGSNVATAIVAGQTISMDLCARISVTNLGTGSATLYCKPNGGATFQTLITHTQGNTQPLNGSVTVRSGDALCYRLTTGVANAGATSTSEFCISDLDATYGIAPVIGLPKGDSISQATAAVPFVVALCRSIAVGSPGQIKNCYGGAINVRDALNNTLSGTQYVRVYANAVTTKSNPDPSAYADVEIGCKAGGLGSYVKIVDITGNDTYSGFFYVRADDILCYSVRTDTHLAANIITHADLEITGALGYNGVSASVCATPECKYHEWAESESGISP